MYLCVVCICALTQDPVYFADLYMRQTNMINERMKAQEPEDIAAPKFTETQDNQQEFTQVYTVDWISNLAENNVYAKKKKIELEFEMFMQLFHFAFVKVSCVLNMLITQHEFHLSL